MADKANRAEQGNACVGESWWQSLWTAEAERGIYTVRSNAMSTAIKPATNALPD